jgi:hypothetical protein
LKKSFFVYMQNVNYIFSLSVRLASFKHLPWMAWFSFVLLLYVVLTSCFKVVAPETFN